MIEARLLLDEMLCIYIIGCIVFIIIALIILEE